MIDLPTLGIVVSAAVINSINPYTIGTLIFIISVILGKGNSSKKLLFLGGAYSFGIFLTYLATGLGLTYLFSEMSLIVADYLAVVIGLLVMFVGILEVKDYFWYERGISLRTPTKCIDMIHNHATTKTSFFGFLVLGMFVAAVELPFTGAPYLAVVTMFRTDLSLTTFLLLGLYSLILVLPLAITLGMVASGTKISAVAKWKEESKATIRLLIGVLLAFLSWIVLLTTNGTINFG